MPMDEMRIFLDIPQKRDEGRNVRLGVRERE